MGATISAAADAEDRATDEESGTSEPTWRHL